MLNKLVFDFYNIEDYVLNVSRNFKLIIFHYVSIWFEFCFNVQFNLCFLLLYAEFLFHV